MMLNSGIPELQTQNDIGYLRKTLGVDVTPEVMFICLLILLLPSCFPYVWQVSHHEALCHAQRVNSPIAISQDWISYDETIGGNFIKIRQAVLKLAHKARYHLKITEYNMNRLILGYSSCLIEPSIDAITSGASLRVVSIELVLINIIFLIK